MSGGGAGLHELRSPCLPRTSQLGHFGTTVPEFIPSAIAPEVYERMGITREGALPKGDPAHSSKDRDDERGDERD